MMNAINNLKKSHGNHTLQPQTILNTVTSLSTDNFNSDMGPQITPLFSVPILSSSTKPVISKNTTIENREQILSNILKRVTTLEGQLEKNKKKLKCALSLIKQKDDEIVKLKEQIRLRDEERLDLAKKLPNKGDHDVPELLEITRELQTRISLIEDFLKADSCDWYLKSSATDCDQFCHCSPENLLPDLDLLLLQINELNFEAGEIHVCQKTKQGAGFQNCQTMSVTFYSNGMQLEGHPFREYSDLMTQIFIKDILDGFFPSELQNEFPRGVIFNVCDRRNEAYIDDEWCKSSIFKGRGCKLDSKLDELSLQELKMKKRKMQSHYEEVKLKREKNNPYTSNFPVDSACIHVEELNRDTYRRKFINSISRNRKYVLNDGNAGGDCNSIYRQNNEKIELPDVTIKDGQVCNYKKNTSKSSKNSCWSSTKIKLLNNPEVGAADSTIQLKIRSLNDKDLYILTMHINDTVGRLRSYLPEDVKDCSIMYYKVGFNRIYLTDDASTLKDYGILKNSVLVLSKPKAKSEL